MNRGELLHLCAKAKRKKGKTQIFKQISPSNK